MHILNIHPVLLAALFLIAPGTVLAMESLPSEKASRSMVEQIEQDLRNLTANLARLDQQIHDLDQSPSVADPTLQPLRKVHQVGWQLHRKQWLYQREHLQFARDQLRRAQTDPAHRAQLLVEWRKHEQEFRAGMAELQRERAALEQQHLQLEGELIERELR